MFDSAAHIMRAENSRLYLSKLIEQYLKFKKSN